MPLQRAVIRRVRRLVPSAVMLAVRKDLCDDAFLCVLCSDGMTRSSVRALNVRLCAGSDWGLISHASDLMLLCTFRGIVVSVAVCRCYLDFAVCVDLALIQCFVLFDRLPNWCIPWSCCLGRL
jgi:hypothetical protein